MNPENELNPRFRGSPDNPYGQPLNPYAQPANPYGRGYQPAPVAAPQASSGSVTRGGLPIVLDEKQLLVTLTLDVVKLLPAK